MMKLTTTAVNSPKPASRSERFIATAHELGREEAGARFHEKLKKKAGHTPAPEKPK